MAGSTWYACKFCQAFFESSLQLKKHKLLKHVPELLRIKNEKRKKREAAAIPDGPIEAVPVLAAAAAIADEPLEAVPLSVAATPEVPNPDEAVLEEIEPPKPKKFRFAAEPSDTSLDEVRSCNEALPEVPFCPDDATREESDPRETHSEVPDTVPAFPEVQLPADVVAYLDSKISAQAAASPDAEPVEFSAEEMLPEPESTAALEAPSEVPDSILETTPQDESLFESTSSRTTCPGPEAKSYLKTPSEEEPSSPFQALLDAIFECDSEIKALSSDQSLFEESSQNTSFRDDRLSESQHIFTENSSEDGECVPGFKTIRNASDSNYETIGNDASKSESLTEEQGQAVMGSYIKEAESSICSTDLVKKELIRENEANFRQSKSVSRVEQNEDKTADEEDEDFDLSFLTADDMGYPEGVTRDPNGSKSDIVVAIKVEPIMESAIQLNDFYQKYSKFKRAHLKNEFKQSYSLQSAKTAHYTEYQWSKDDQHTQHLFKSSSDGQLGNMEWEALDDHRRNTLDKFNGIEPNETMVQRHNGAVTRHDLSEPEGAGHVQQNYAQVNHPSLQRHAMVEPSPYPVAPRQNMTAPPAAPRTNMAAPSLIYTAASRDNMAVPPHYYPMPNVVETQRNVSNFMRPWQSPSKVPTQQQYVSQLQVPPMTLTQPETARFIATQQQLSQQYVVPRQEYPKMTGLSGPDHGQSMYGKFRSDIFTQPGQEHVVIQHPYRPWQAAEQGVTATRQTLCQQQPCVCGTGSMQNLPGPVISPSMLQPPRHGHHNSPRINTVESVQNNSDGGDQPRQNVPGPVHKVQFEQQPFDHFQMVMRMRELEAEMARKRQIRQALQEKITSTLMQNVPEPIQVLATEPDRHHFTEHNPTIPERCNASEYGRRRHSLSLCQPPPSYLNVPEPVLVTDTGRDTPDPTQWSEPRQNVPEPFILEVESVSAIPEREPQVLRQTTPDRVIPLVKVTPTPLIEPTSAPGHQPSATDADVEHLFRKYQLAEYLYREDPSCRSYICTFCVRNFQLFKSALSHVLQHKVGLTQNGDMGRLQGCMQEYCQNFRVIKYKKRVGRRLTPLKNRGPLDFNCPLLDCGRQFAKQSGLKSHLKRHETISIVSGRKELPAVNDENGSSSFSGNTKNLDGIRVEVITTSGGQTVPEGLTDSASDADEGQNSPIPKPACNTCGKSFENEDDLLTHVCRPPSPPKFQIRRRKRRATKQPHSKQNFSCSVCDESFQHRTPFKHHMMDVHGKFTATCSFCSKTFTTRWSLDYHLKMHIGRNLKLERKLFPRIQKKREPYVYAPSSTGKSTIRRVMAALKNHVPPPAGSTSKSPLLIQLLQKKRLPHNKSSRASQRSRGPVADEPVQPQSARTLPPRKHWKKAVLDKIRPKPSTSVMAYASVGTHSCSKCGLSFHSSVELDIHDSQTHTGKTLIEVEYCTFCGLMYWNSKRLEEHTQLHETQQLECVCQKCNQRFDSIEAFNNHMSQQHRPV